MARLNTRIGEPYLIATKLIFLGLLIEILGYSMENWCQNVLSP